MNTQLARQILTKSISNLQNRIGQLELSDIETEVINNACLHILRNHNDQVKKVHDVSQIGSVIGDNFRLHESIATFFIYAGIELFPNSYGSEEANHAKPSIIQNISWSGMWDFLRDYFQKNHGIQIDSVETSPSIFYSTKHKRYENGYLVSESEVDRIVNINFIKEKKEIIVSIEPALSPKNGYLISKTTNQLTFKGFDPDYLFTDNFDSFEEIEVFTLDMPNRNLKIVYYE